MLKSAATIKDNTNAIAALVRHVLIGSFDHHNIASRLIYILDEILLCR